MTKFRNIYLVSFIFEYVICGITVYCYRDIHLDIFWENQFNVLILRKE